MTQANTTVGSVLGFLLAGYANKSTGTGTYETISWNSATRTPAEDVWDGYLKDEPSGLLPSSEVVPAGSFESPSPSAVETSYIGYKGRRIADANFYYALDAIATNYLALKIGNVGAQEGAKVPKILIAKAQGLQAIAKSGIARFEEWCKTEAAVYGANYIADLTVAGQDLASVYGLASEGVDEATDFFHKNAADFVWATNPTTADACASYSPSFGSPSPSAGDPMFVSTHVDWIIAYGGFGYAIRNIAAKIMLRRMGYSDARDPRIAQYYQNMGNSLADIAAKIIEVYEKYITAQKIQLAVYRAGI